MGVGGCASPQKPSSSAVDGIRQSWRLGCQICVLDLEPIHEGLITTERGSQSQYTMLEGQEQWQEGGVVNNIQTDFPRSNSKSD